MACFDVYPNPDGQGYVVDVQSDLFDDYGTRVVVPLLSPDIAPRQVRRLNPIFDVAGTPYSLHPHFIATIPARSLTSPVASLAHEDYAISGAIDMMLKGV